MFQFSAAVRASFLLRQVSLHFTSQMRRQRPPRRSHRNGFLRDPFGRFRFQCSALLQFSQPQFQLLDLAIHFLRRSSELHAPQLSQQQLEMFDLRIAGLQLLVMYQDLLVLFYDQSFQFTGIERFQVGKNVIHCRKI